MTHFKLTTNLSLTEKDLPPKEILEIYTEKLRQETGDNTLVLYACVYNCDFCSKAIETGNRKYWSCEKCGKVYDYCPGCNDRVGLKCSTCPLPGPRSE